MAYSRFDPAEPIRSESVLLSVTTDDASASLFGRLCRYPSARVAWIWVMGHLPDRSFGFVTDGEPCGAERVDPAAADVRYAPLDPARACFERRGARETPSEARFACRLPAHACAHLPAGPGPVDLEAEASFVGEHAAGATLAGRTELLGRARAAVALGRERFEIEGRAQWHEQEQDAPRFREPFTYASLRGPRHAMVLVAGPWGSRAFVRSDREQARALGASFDGLRAARVELAGRDPLEISLDVRHRGSLPLYGRRWLGHQVVARLGGERLSGFVNRWDPGGA
jgi:hypothetical protein